jgi:choline dehydrogenase
MNQPMSLDSNSMAALDSSLKMRGVQRLRVVDCSVMPTVLSVNANWSEVMLGERATNLILGQM